MKKILFFAACAAATAAFTGCSSDDALNPTPIVTPDEPTEKGTPLKVVVGNGTSRADLSKTTTASLTNFTLYGMQPENYWLTGTLFTGGNGSWSSTDNPTWPITNKSVATTFYGFSDGVTSGTPTGLTPSITPSEQKFTFTFGEGVSSTLYYAKQTETQLNGKPTALRNSQRDAFQSTATVLEEDRLVDLLVTHDGTDGTTAISAKETDDEGKINLKFKHSMGTLKIRAFFVGDETKYFWKDGCTFYIEWIRIHGLYTSGTYTFGSGWSFSNTDTRDLYYQKNFGEEDGGIVGGTEDLRWSMEVQPYSADVANGTVEPTYKTIVEAGEFMVIPQDYTEYAYPGNTGTPLTIEAAAAANKDCYIELYGYFKQGGSTSYTNKGVLGYFPLTVKNLKVLPGKQHVITLNLTEILKKDGNYVATPSTVITG